MSDIGGKGRIIEAMVKSVFEGMGKPRLSFSPEFEASVREQCGRELDAALPLIRDQIARDIEALAWMREQTIKAIIAGYGRKEIDAHNEAIECAARIVRGDDHE
jgi:hypothetical protein